MFKCLAYYLALRPHRAKLLTSSARYWFCSVSVLIGAMALTEGIAWGYLGWLFGTSGLERKLTAAFVGGLMFVVIWIVDASLITLDRSAAEHATALLGKKAPKQFVGVLRDVLRFGFRVGLIAASLTVTSPYLAQIVFHKDIQATLKIEAVHSIGKAREGLAAPFDLKLRELEERIDKKVVEHDTEVAGKGRSGRYGEGPASKALLADIAALKVEASNIRAEATQSLRKFDLLATNWELNRGELEALYGVTLPAASIAQNRRLLNEFRMRPENRDTELAIKVFLGIIFSGLMLSKILEPPSVRYYLSDVLQAEYDRYLAAAFDGMLQPCERSTSPGAVMTPQRLYEFLSEVLVPEKMAPRTKEAMKSLVVLENIRVQIEFEVDRAKGEVETACEENNDAEQSLSELMSAIESVGADLEKFRADLASAESGVYPTQLDEEGRIAYENLLRGKVANASWTHDQLEDTLPAEIERRKKAAEAIAPAKERLKKLESELALNKGRIEQLRTRWAESVGRSADGALGG